ncbi:MAG: hypothetical protein EWM47_11830 [Anaerolineaceae bacterium]|nr:MAG: hypothetical protein EWM47_11830 [Anaerolineaceae bacterium]
MEIGFHETTATLVAYIDGNASLYLSSGGGVIGGFAHESVRNAAVAFVNESQGFMKKGNKVQSYSLPQSGHVIFYLMSKNEVYSRDIEETKLQNYESEFTKLYAYGQNVITELRKIAG